MKYAIMSDAHANPPALEAALKDARDGGCERFIFLGDATGYGYDAKAVIDAVRREFDVALMGNHDSACLGLEPRLEVMSNHNYDIDRVQGEGLSSEDADWLRGLGYEHVENGMAFAHGDFTNPRMWNYIIFADAAIRNFSERDELLMFCGHTHHAAIWELTGGGMVRVKFAHRFIRPATSAESVSFKLSEGSRYIVNVGSIGYPRSDMCSTYGMYDDVERRMTVRRLPFDFGRYIKGMLDSKFELPIWLVRRLMGDER